MGSVSLSVPVAIISQPAISFFFCLSEFRHGKLTRVVGTTDADSFGKGILGGQGWHSRDTKSIEFCVGSIQLAVGAPDTTHRLAGCTLGLGPLRLQVTGRALIRAESTLGTGLAADGSDNVLDERLEGVEGGVLDSTPTTQTVVIERHRTVLGGEGAAI